LLESEFKYEIDNKKAQLLASASGWVSTRIFVSWARRFAEWVDSFRASGPFLPDAEAMLILDNAPTHDAEEAMEIFRQHHISVMTFPPHCTHILQPIDVSIARSFKNRFSAHYRRLEEPGELQMVWGEDRFMNASGIQRAKVVQAVISASKEATPAITCQRAFHHCGLWPMFGRDCGLERILKSRFVRESDEDPELLLRASGKGKCCSGSRLLTSPSWMREKERFRAEQEKARSAKQEAVRLAKAKGKKPPGGRKGKTVAVIEPVVNAVEIVLECEDEVTMAEGEIEGLEVLEGDAERYYDELDEDEWSRTIMWGGGD
jgi:hypothetical protein